MISCEIVRKACTRMATAKRKEAILIQAYIRNMTGEQYLAAIAREPSVIIPTGSCEIYGPHLPMGTDLLAAQGIAERIAQRTGFLIAPAIEMGESSALSAFPCTFAMPRHILEDYLDFLVGKLVSDGVKRIVCLTGHAGNVDTVSYIAKKYLHTHGLQSCQIDWWRFARTHSDGILTNTGSMAHGHASECGTSVMLHLYPDLVDRRSALPVTVPTDDAFPDVIQYAPFSARTENGCIGAAADASAEKGAQLVEVCVERILAYLETVWYCGPGRLKYLCHYNNWRSKEFSLLRQLLHRNQESAYEIIGNREGKKDSFDEGSRQTPGFRFPAKRGQTALPVPSPTGIPPGSKTPGGPDLPGRWQGRPALG